MYVYRRLFYLQYIKEISNSEYCSSKCSIVNCIPFTQYAHNHIHRTNFLCVYMFVTLWSLLTAPLIAPLQWQCHFLIHSKIVHNFLQFICSIYVFVTLCYYTCSAFYGGKKGVINVHLDVNYSIIHVYEIINYNHWLCSFHWSAQHGCVCLVYSATFVSILDPVNYRKRGSACSIEGNFVYVISLHLLFPCC